MKLHKISNLISSNLFRPIGLWMLKRTFGGMGSLNDICLVGKDDEKLRQELNELFDNLLLLRATENQKEQYEIAKQKQDMHPRIANSFRR